MADQRTREQLEEELADSLYAILANYEREGAGPGSRFEGQTCEYAQAKFAVRMVLAWRQSPDGQAEVDEINRERCEAVNRAMEAEAILRDLLKVSGCDHPDDHQTCPHSRARRILAALDGEEADHG